jgi:sterol desaturase/sphingolipid hydroxylase (fatty acid hydroxylase superfamily)
METYAAVLQYAIPGFIGLILIEAIAGAKMGKQVIRSFDSISSISSGITNVIKDILGLTVVILSYEVMVEYLAVWEWQSSPWWIYLVAFVGKDFAGYWSHRWEHAINVFWSRHLIHHSSEEFNLACALRQNVSIIFGVFFFLYLPMALIGVPAKVVAIVAPLHLFAQFWYHTTLIDKMGWLESILVTPSHHRVHHAINDRYMDRNFSQVFIVWDKLFGTFQPELRSDPPVYGIRRQPNTWNPVKINFQHFFILAKDSLRADKWSDKLLLWFMPTGWRPQDQEEQHPVPYTVHASEQEKYDTHAVLGVKVWAWFQLIVHVAILMHFFQAIGHYSFVYLLAYGGWLILSIYAYTEMMDGSVESVLVEVVKAVTAICLMLHLGGWYTQVGVDVTMPVLAYLTVSLGGTILVYTRWRPVVQPLSAAA